MVDRAETARMTIDRHIVGRVDEDHCGPFLAHQRREGHGIEGIAAQDTMAAEDPRIADLAERWPAGTSGNTSAGSASVSDISSSVELSGGTTELIITPLTVAGSMPASVKSSRVSMPYSSTV